MKGNQIIVVEPPSRCIFHWIKLLSQYHIGTAGLTVMAISSRLDMKIASLPILFRKRFGESRSNDKIRTVLCIH